MNFIFFSHIALKHFKLDEKHLRETSLRFFESEVDYSHLNHDHRLSIPQNQNLTFNYRSFNLLFYTFA